MDQIIAAASMVLSGYSQRIDEGQAADILWNLFLDSDVCSSNFLGAADEGRDSLVSRAMAGHVTVGTVLLGRPSAWTNVAHAQFRASANPKKWFPEQSLNQSLRTPSFHIVFHVIDDGARPGLCALG